MLFNEGAECWCRARESSSQCDATGWIYLLLKYEGGGLRAFGTASGDAEGALPQSRRAHVVTDDPPTQLFIARRFHFNNKFPLRRFSRWKHLFLEWNLLSPPFSHWKLNFKKWAQRKKGETRKALFIISDTWVCTCGCCFYLLRRRSSRMKIIYHIYQSAFTSSEGGDEQRFAGRLASSLTKRRFMSVPFVASRRSTLPCGNGSIEAVLAQSCLQYINYLFRAYRLAIRNDRLWLYKLI